MKIGAIPEAGLEVVELNNETFFRISDVDSMRPFFMSIVSDSDHWMFVSSNGGISSGRKNADYALFPYDTDDKITESAEMTGSKTLVRVRSERYTHLWEPFSVRSEGRFELRRNLYLNQWCNKIRFEEINLDLQLSFQYEWCTSHRFGFVRQAWLTNLSAQQTQTIQLIDGLQNILPFGVPADLQTTTSNLVDAYKRSELIERAGLGIYALSAIIVDKAEPAEALKANVAWSVGLDQPKYLLSALQLRQFRKDAQLQQEVDVKGEKGSFLLESSCTLAPGAQQSWMLVANVQQSHSDIIELTEQLQNAPQLAKLVIEDVQAGTLRLRQLTAAADGFQYTADLLKDTRHYSNVLFNIMRGGVFDNHYQIEKWDFERYLQKANPQVASEIAPRLQSLPEEFSLFALRELVDQVQHPDFERLATEYLPLKFSRRHGDPSRPWNKFSINTRNETDGSKVLDYQGNWRDIFQNWEALAHSYPAFIEGMISKFLNASTFDGYNPYRVTKDGFDWETIEPDNPWSYIGYWGDHQIIYLLKFLEFTETHQSGMLASTLHADKYVYANVPYRIKPYEDIVQNPKDTIEFDHQAENRIRERIKHLGADGALLAAADGSICRVNFTEKILATVLAKLANLVPEGGIWMNTQRPEWNDANNALVGNGVSMVTLYYLRRFLQFWVEILPQSPHTEVPISSELHEFFSKLAHVFESHLSLLQAPLNDSQRKRLTDALGKAGSEYRLQIYERGFAGHKKTLGLDTLLKFVKTALRYVDQSISANRRADGLYHAYNLLKFEGDSLKVSPLSEMLEGQVAVLSSGVLSAQESLQLLDALQQSALYRQDQNSYTLYPNKALPKFLEKNILPASAVERSTLLQQLLRDQDRSVLEQDSKGGYHFNGSFKNANDLRLALEALGEQYQPIVVQEQELVLELFEAVFRHQEFTGRSGTFFAFEGLGSIYWHMVSKLALAVQETCLRAAKQSVDNQVLSALIAHYYEIADGIGVHKSPQRYGAFPTIPYSHTPLHKGAQQPGMTGQVKEDILCRFGELGVWVRNRQLVFEPVLLRASELLPTAQAVAWVDHNGQRRLSSLPAGALLFTYGGVPIEYHLSQVEGVEIERADGTHSTQPSLALSEADTESVIRRKGTIQKIRVLLSRSRFRD